MLREYETFFKEKKMRKKGYPISIAIVLASLSFTMPAMAQKVPGFSDNVSVDQMQTSFERQRSEEEWAKLRDNVISWEEIGDLVHEYNPTVSSLWRNFRESDSKGSYNVNVEDAMKRHCPQQTETAWRKLWRRCSIKATAVTFPRIPLHKTQTEKLPDFL